MAYHHIISTGRELALMLHTLAEARHNHRYTISDIAGNIDAVVTALQDINLVILDEDRNPAFRLLKDECRSRIETLAFRCRVVFEALAITFNVAAEGGKERARAKLKAKSKYRGGYTSSSKYSSDEDDYESFGKKKKEEGKSRLPDDLTNLRHLHFAKVVNCPELDWDWALNFVEQCEVHLNMIKIALVFHLQIAHLVRFQLTQPMRGPGAFDHEQALRLLVCRLGQRYRECMQGLTTVYRELKEDDASTITTTPSILSVTDVASLPPDLPSAGDDGFTVKEGLEDPIQLDVTNRANLPQTEMWSEKPYGPAMPVKDEGALDDKTVAEVNPVVAPMAAPVAASNEPTTVTKGSAASPATALADGGFPAAIAEATPSRIPAWIRRIFSGRRKRAVKGVDAGGRLEAYFLEQNRPYALCLPFSDAQIRYGLAKVMEGKQADVWGPYFSLDAQRRRDLDNAISQVKQQQENEATIVVMQVQPARDEEPESSAWPDETMSKGQGVLFFVQFGTEEVPPIYVLDHTGRKLRVPWEHGRTWEKVVRVMGRSAWGGHIPWQRLDIVLDDAVIPCQAWESTIKPGMTIELREAGRQLTYMCGPLPSNFGASPHRAPGMHPMAGAPPLGFPPGQVRVPFPPGWVPPLPTPAPVPDIVQVEKPNWAALRAQKMAFIETAERLGLMIDTEEEAEMSKEDLGELLRRWTFAPDIVGMHSEDDSELSMASDPCSDSDTETIEA